MSQIDAQDLAARYAAVWNESDPGLRRRAVEALWAPDGVHLLQPPEEMRAEAARLGFAGTTLVARGHAELEARVTRAHEEFVATGEYVFRAAPDSAAALEDVVTFRWESVLAATGAVTGGGLEFVTVDEDGRISRDCQFPAL
ncbi:hypothetical protein [Streptomyces sp. VRA16 Mangrove soil]|uniref:hypothetical protein n=1 Tax=Streptomyces sp. VRA16 Mangrove soil TaxID=2817434 RepID=UPI001A9F410A|nr:hypothetical protein [Streptomyces sp. VRA16 Mangrove soil]MBO1329715.1 hypothetical protein [Streptomyces sp. VRA16 Mangrove soil]